MARLHLGKQRDDVLGVGHEGGLTHVARDALVAGRFIHDGADDVLDVRDAHDAIHVLVVDRHARVAGAPHDLERLHAGLGVLDGAHVHARDHHLACDGVTKVDDVVNHRLLLLGELLAVGDHVADLVLGDVLAVITTLDVQQECEAVGAGSRESHKWLGDARKTADGAGDPLGDAFRVRQRHALGYELAYHDGEVRDDERDEHRGQRMSHVVWDADANEHLGQRRREVGCRKRGREEADEGDGHLDSCEELARVARDLGRLSGARIALLGLVLENHLLGGGESHLRHGEVAVDKGKQERDCDRECYVHAPLRDLLGRVS